MEEVVTGMCVNFHLFSWVVWIFRISATATTATSTRCISGEPPTDDVERHGFSVRSSFGAGCIPERYCV